MLKVLVVDDQASVRTALEVLCELHGLPVVTASGPEQALHLVEQEELGVVVQDMNFQRDTTSGQEGVELMRAIRKVDPELPIVLLTAFTSLEMAVQLVKEGANDYLAKPWDDEKLVATLKNLVQLRQLQQENLRLTWRGQRARRDLRERHDLCGLIYESQAMHDLLTLAVKVAPSQASVLILGPNGAGKERIADIVHVNSRRKNAPLVKLNAGALNDNLVDAELFGAEAGAYTGAQKTRVGRFEQAHGGTLFLDEIGNLSLEAQKRLLRVLQTGELQRLGSNVTRQVDVRVLSATNADLPRLVAEGTFREDLYFRLNVIELRLPALRDRLDDVMPLTRYFLETTAKKEGVALAELSEGARQALLGYDWPGNVRELENRVTRACLVCSGNSISASDLGFSELEDRGRGEARSAQADAEMEEIQAALKDAGGVVARAAAQLGLSRQALYRRMERLGIELQRVVRT